MNLDELINMNYGSLNESDLHIWRYINSHREECSKQTIIELGKKCNVSRTTILRFAKKLNLDGFSELKYYLRNESVVEKLNESNLLDLEAILKNYTVMIGELKNKNFNSICEMIESAKRIIVVATGTMQTLVAEVMQSCFLRIGIVMIVIKGSAEITRIPKWIEEDDLVIMISFSGEQNQIVELARELKIKGSATISITKLAANSVSKLVDEAVYVFSDDITFKGYDNSMYITMFFFTVETLFIRYFNYIKLKGK